MSMSGTRLGTTALVLLALAGCGTAAKDSASDAGAGSAATASTVVATGDGQGDPSTKGQPCATFVGRPTEDIVILSSLATGVGRVTCITSASADNDATVLAVLPTKCPTGAKEQVYGWYSTDPAAPDQHVDAGRIGGRVVVLPHGTPGLNPISDYLTAACA